MNEEVTLKLQNFPFQPNFNSMSAVHLKRVIQQL